MNAKDSPLGARLFRKSAACLLLVIAIKFYIPLGILYIKIAGISPESTVLQSFLSIVNLDYISIRA
jgi:hypothetical protein